MGMFDTITCEYPLPDGYDARAVQFQTKDLDNSLLHYTITADGRLVAHRVEYEATPPEEQPLYGTPAWEAGGLARMLGMLRPKRTWDEEVPYHGDITFYCTNVTAAGPEGFATEQDAPRDDREYTARFTEGRVVRISGGADHSWDPGRHVPRQVLMARWHTPADPTTPPDEVASQTARAVATAEVEQIVAQGRAAGSAQLPPQATTVQVA